MDFCWKFLELISFQFPSWYVVSTVGFNLENIIDFSPQTTDDSACNFLCNYRAGLLRNCLYPFKVSSCGNHISPLFGQMCLARVQTKKEEEGTINILLLPFSLFCFRKGDSQHYNFSSLWVLWDLRSSQAVGSGIGLLMALQQKWPACCVAFLL